MESLPVEFSHPTVQAALRDYIALVRLQVLTPLSLLVNIASVTICASLTNPNIRQISGLHPTSISPKPAVLAVYIMTLYAGQLGYCLLLVFARKPETKKTLTQGVGVTLVISNWVMALWAVTWIFEWFLLSTILQGILLALLIYSNVVLIIYHSPTSKRPLDAMLIHAPLRFFLVLQGFTFPLSLFIQLGLTYTPTTPEIPADYKDHPWPGFAVVMVANLIGTLVIILRRDIVWAVAATWICVSIWSKRPKPSPIYITALVFTALHPVTLLGCYIYSWIYKRRTVVALPPGDEHPGLYRGQSRPGDVEQSQSTNGPREVNADEVWG